MSFERAGLLLLMPLPFAWALWRWRRAGNRCGLLLKALCAALILLALAGPAVSVWETKTALAVLVDTSASVSPADLERASKLVAAIEDARGRNLVRVMPFAEQTRPLLPAERRDGWRFQPSPGPPGRATNLEAALEEALAAMPAGHVPRIALISDGRENRGSVTRAAWQARELGAPVDAFLLHGRPEPELRLRTARFPSLVFAGERFPIELAVRSPRKVEGRVGFSAEGRLLGSSAASLRAGENRLTVRASVNTPGTFDLAGVLEAPGLGEVRFAQAVTVRRPRVLFLSQDPEGTESHLMEALRAAEFEFVKAPAFPPTGFGAFQVVILNNWDLERIPEPLKRDLESHVRGGGGLLVIAGERNLYVEDRARREDELERALPARLLPPRSPEGTCVVLIVDKSSSMEGKKMELARLSAIGVVENLRPVDRVGVLIFDNSFQWAVPIRRAEDKNQIKRLISGIIADGGTQIAPALSEAYRRALPVQATYKHIVLLTDGISEEGDSVSLAQEAASQRVTISTVGLGQDVNKAFLDKVASLAKGKSHFLTDPAGLAQILLRDVLEHTGQTAVEKPVAAVVEKEAEVIAGLDLASAPPLLGYVRFEAKPTADLILRFEPKDPLLVRWQYGLGRAAVFTSDAKSRWAEAWVRWPGFDPFWVNVVRDLLPHSAAGQAEVRLDGATGELTANYRLAAGVAEPAAPPEIFVLGAGGFRRPLAVRKLAPGAWEGRVRMGRAAEGLFRIRPLEESSAFPEAGLYLPERELSEFGSREELLRGIAEFTGGRFEPPAARLFETAGRGVPATLNLWAGLLGLAALVNLGELVHRKWRGITNSGRRPG